MELFDESNAKVMGVVGALGALWQSRISRLRAASSTDNVLQQNKTARCTNYYEAFVHTNTSCMLNLERWLLGQTAQSK